MGYTSKDRVLAALSGERPDRIPVFEYLIHDGVLSHFGCPRIAPGDTMAHLAGCARCLDLCHPLSDAPYEPGERLEADGSKMVYERWMNWRVPGAAHRDARQAELQRIERLEQGDCVPPSLKELRRQKAARDAVTREMVYISCFGCCALPYDNTEDSIYLFADEPELVGRRMRAENRRLMETLEATAHSEISPVAIIWDDIAYKTGLFYSLEVLERTLFPALREVCDLLHSRGIKVIFHSDGNITQALPGLIACGIDGLNPLERSAGMRVEEFVEHFGGQVALVGGMDAVESLSRGSVHEVVEETRRLIDVAGRKGGLICASSSGQIDESMPTENVVAYLETVWAYGRR